MNTTPPTSDRIMMLVNGYWATGILGAAASHRLFTHLAAGEDTAEKLAAAAGIAERGAQTLLDGLVSLGLAESHNGTYRNSADADAYLVEGKPSCLAAFAQLKMGHMGALANLPEVVRAGRPLSDAVVEVADNPHWERLVTAIAAQSVPVAAIAAEKLGLAGAGEISILDVGGGSGIYSATWLGLNPHARATQLDWRPINAIASRLLADKGVGDRFTCVNGDFHTTDLGTARYDVAVYSHIAHQEGPEDNIALFEKLRRALKPGGTLVVNDYVVDDDRAGPPFALLFGAEMLLKSKHGGTWRRADYAGWLAKAGFDDVSFQTTPSPATVIFAR